MVSDHELVFEAKDGDRGAVAALVRRYFHVVEGVCRQHLASRSDAEDAAQDVLLKFVAAMPLLDGDRPVGPWIRTLAKNHCTDLRRRAHTPSADTPTDTLAAVSPTPEQAYLTIERHAELTETLDAMSTHDVTLLVRRHVDETPVAQIGHEVGMTRGAVAVALTRARTRARAIARRKGLLGLFPWPRLRWWRALLSRVQPLEAAVGLLAPAILVVGGLAISIPDPVPVRPLADAASGGAVDELVPSPEGTGASRPSPRVTPRALGRSAPPPTGATGGAVGKGAWADRHAAVDFDPVAVPATGRQLSADPPREGAPDYDFGVDTGVPGLTVGVEVYDEPEQRPLHEAVCVVAETAPAGTYCHRGDGED